MNWKKQVIVYFNVLYKYSSEWTEEFHLKEISNQYPVRESEGLFSNFKSD
jgi:hypothetical protein